MPGKNELPPWLRLEPEPCGLQDHHSANKIYNKMLVKTLPGVLGYIQYTSNNLIISHDDISIQSKCHI